MTEIILESIPDSLKVYISVDDSPFNLYSNPQKLQLPVGEHCISVMCKNKTDIKYKLDYLSSKNAKNRGAFLPYCFNFEILSFKYTYKINVLKSNGRILLKFERFGYINFFGYRSSQFVLTAHPEKLYITDAEGPLFINKKQKIKFEFSQIINIIISLLPYLGLILFLLMDAVGIILNNSDRPAGGYRSLGPQDSIFFIYIPFLIVLLVLSGYLIFKLFKTSNSYWKK